MPRSASSGKQAKVVQQRISQKELPKRSLEEALRVAEMLADNFGGGPAAPHQVAIAMGISPTSSSWRVLTGATVGYGLTDGGYNSDQIRMTALAKRILRPTEEGETGRGLVEAALTPQLHRAFFQRYEGSKFPRADIGRNVLCDLGVPSDDTEEALSAIEKNGVKAGIIQNTKTGPFVSTKVSSLGEQRIGAIVEADIERTEDGRRDSPADPPRDKILELVPAAEKPKNNRVFITHGRNRKIVDQLKELLTFGGFEPVVAVESETTSIPVTEKVFHDGGMKGCAAGIIHIESEEELLDASGGKRNVLNENVLIEIGAALALYGKNIILLVKEGTKLPSNLQGLYRLDYSESGLDFQATLKILRAFDSISAKGGRVGA